MSQIYIASPLLERTENTRTAFTVTRVSLDWVIQHYVPLGIPIMGQCSPSKVWLSPSAAGGFAGDSLSFRAF